MFLLSLARVLKFSFQDLIRNIWLSLVTIIILVLALFSINMLLTVTVISDSAITAIKEKVDINLFLKSDAEDNQIISLRAKISDLPETGEIKYISKNEALENFKIKHKNDPEILDALRELGKNPLAPSLVISPKNADQYEELISGLNKINDDIIESRNFEDHKLMLAKINSISNKVKEVGVFVSSVFVVISLLVVFNAIRVAIYTHRKEIAIMKLVGASNTFIKSPFLISSVIYAFVGSVLVVAIFYPFLSILQPYLEAFFVDYQVNLISYFNNNFFLIFGLEFIGASLINVLASIIAVGKYSKV